MAAMDPDLHPDEQFVASLAEKAPGYRIDVYKVRRTSGALVYDLRTIVEDTSPKGEARPTATRSLYITPENLGELGGIARQEGLAW